VLRVVDPFETAVHVREDGTVDIGEQTDSRVRTGEDGVIVADLPPGVRANLGAVRMSGSSKHHGERHPEGDELVYLLSGSVGVSFERSGSEEREVVPLQPGQLVVVPRGTWHWLVVDEPSELIFITPRADGDSPRPVEKRVRDRAAPTCRSRRVFRPPTRHSARVFGARDD